MAVPTVSVKSATDLLALIPVALGYSPLDSIVLCGLRRQRLSLTARFDIPETPRDRRAAVLPLVEAVLRSHIEELVLIAYHTGPDSNALPMVGLLSDAFDQLGITVRAPIYVSGDPTTGDASYCCMCHDPSHECTGTVPPPMTIPTLSPPARSRAEVVARIEAGSRAEAVARCLAAYQGPVEPAQAEDATRALLATPIDQLPDEAVALTAHVIRSNEANQWLLSGGHPLTADPECDPFTGAAERLRDNSTRIERLTELATCLPDDAAGECLEVLAATAYLLGDGTLGHVALDRAERARELGTLGRLIRGLLAHAVPPYAITDR